MQRLYIVLRPESGERCVEEKQAPDSGKEGEKISEGSKDKKENDDVDVKDASIGSEGGHGREVLVAMPL